MRDSGAMQSAVPALPITCSAMLFFHLLCPVTLCPEVLVIVIIINKKQPILLFKQMLKFSDWMVELCKLNVSLDLHGTCTFHRFPVIL